jgi:mannose-6-phosphate isomerase-like protein (cupin superfamily)
MSAAIRPKAVWKERFRTVTGRLLLEEKGVDRYAELRSVEPYYRKLGVEHNVVNANEGEFVFIEIEMKP